MKALYGILIIGMVAVMGVVIILLVAWAIPNQPETVYPKQSTRECDTTYRYNYERLLLSIAFTDMIFTDQGTPFVAQTIDGNTGRFSDELIYTMIESRKAAEENDKRIKTGRIGKSYGPESVEN